MRIVVVGVTGTIGRAVKSALAPRHEIVGASRKTQPPLDLDDAASIRAFFQAVGSVDAVVSCAGNAAFKPFAQLSDADYALSLGSKLMGQVNLVRIAMAHVRDGGSITLTSGVLARDPMPGSGAVSLVNAALEGFTRAAALEAPRKIRVNVVSPPWISETLTQLGMDPKQGISAEANARAYVEAVEGKATGQVIDAAKFA
jgi:NAD(P)-dependent dehydrogenase (short-subunit alcohol dehydrogenase family)